MPLFSDGSPEAAKLDQPDGGARHAERPALRPSQAASPVHGGSAWTTRSRPCWISRTSGTRGPTRPWRASSWLLGTYPDASASSADHGLQDLGPEPALAATDRDGCAGNGDLFSFFFFFRITLLLVIFSEG